MPFIDSFVSSTHSGFSFQARATMTQSMAADHVASPYPIHIGAIGLS